MNFEMQRRDVLRAGLAAGLVPWITGAQAQSSAWPSKPVTVWYLFRQVVAPTRLPGRCQRSLPK